MEKPLVIVTGATGNLCRSVAASLSSDYRIIGLDRRDDALDFPVLKVDLGSDDSVRDVLSTIRATYGERIASVIHLAAYFDFTGEEHPLYRSVNGQRTNRRSCSKRSQGTPATTAQTIRPKPGSTSPAKVPKTRRTLRRSTPRVTRRPRMTNPPADLAKEWPGAMTVAPGHFVGRLQEGLTA